MTDAGVGGFGRVGKLVQEFILIVVGVSVALGADSLRAAHEDRLREAEYLEQLKADLKENQARLASAILDEETLGAAAVTAMRALKSGVVVSPDSAQDWLVERRALYYSDPRVLTGTFSGLVDSGDLRLIHDPVIRGAIVAYVPQISADQAEFGRFVDTFIEGLKSARLVIQGLPRYEPVISDAAVAAFLHRPADPRMITALDLAIWSNQVRLIYLRRMLAVTDRTAEILAG